MKDKRNDSWRRRPFLFDALNSLMSLTLGVDPDEAAYVFSASFSENLEALERLVGDKKPLYPGEHSMLIECSVPSRIVAHGLEKLTADTAGHLRLSGRAPAQAMSRIVWVTDQCRAEIVRAIPELRMAGFIEMDDASLRIIPDNCPTTRGRAN